MGAQYPGILMLTEGSFLSLFSQIAMMSKVWFKLNYEIFNFANPRLCGSHEQREVPDVSDQY